MDVSVGWLLTSLLVGTVGMGFFMYGKKQTRGPQLLVGLGLMIYPYFVTSTLWMVAVACALLAGLWGALRAGM